ncbi:MAG TPA: beta-propeller fold lactonase family protein [Acidobacteriaceae bacterium]|nr:beta-propeller fold lactonase family protein [Acidobacteriaceae bacterium]
MKFWKYGRVILALIVSLGMGLSFIACGTYTVGYLYVTANGIATSTPGQQLNQIAGFKIDHDFGYLTAITGSPFAANGNKPVQEVLIPGGQLMAVVNKGSSSVSMYSIGGSGVLTFQGNYFTSGSSPVSMALDASGTYLYVADQVAPDGSGRGDITAFQINSSTGKLTLITNQNTFNTSGTQLPYFEVNCKPVQLVVAQGYLFTLDQGYASTSTTCINPNTGATFTPDVFPYLINGSNGQLVLTQNQPLQTGAAPGALSTMYAAPGGKYLYLANTKSNQILPFTIGTGGVLQTLVGGPVNNVGTAVGPDAFLTDSSVRHLYVANFGPASINAPNSTITAYTIAAANGQLQLLPGATPGTPGSYPAGSGPIWMVEDPSNQYLYVANYNDSTITGNVIDASTGQLSALTRGAVTNAPLQPNYLVVSGRVF